jgi:hypothetical protein
MCAQDLEGRLRVRVTDPSGAVVVRAAVLLNTAGGSAIRGVPNSQGIFEFKGLPSGVYSLLTVASGFSDSVLTGITVESGNVHDIDVVLKIAVKQEEVHVNDEDMGINVGSSENSSTIILKGQDLDALSDDPDELKSELEALVGPAAGPNGGEIYVDGFSNGSLPPRRSIREVRVNCSPFSAEYDHAGQGRIEVFTKPGTDQFHGLFMFLPMISALNSVNPFLYSTTGRPNYFGQGYIGNVSGPVGKKASVFFDFVRHDNEDEAVVNAQESSADRLSQSVPISDIDDEFSSRFDYQLNPHNTLTLRYQREQEYKSNNGIGQLVEQSYGTNDEVGENTVRISDTQSFGRHIINEIRLQFMRSRIAANAVDNSVGVVIPGADTRGGNPVSRSADLNNNFELQNYTAVALGRHLLKFGGRLHANRESSLLANNPNGSFTFDSVSAALPSQYTVVSGKPLIDLAYADAGLYLQDEFTLRPNLALSYGLRYEVQTDLRDRTNFAPRVSVAWGMGRGKSNPTVLRAGWGIFYDRFAQNLILQSLRISASGQQEYVISDSSCLAAYPAPPALICAVAPTVYSIGPHLTAPYTSQAAISLEHQLGRSGRLAITYLNSRGLHQLYLDNINAPLDASDPISSRPNPASGNVYQYQSGGIFKQSQLIGNVSIRAGRLSLNAFYSLSYARSNVSGTNVAPGFPSNPYNLNADYGRASFDVRQRIFISGTMSLPWALRVSPYIIASSGLPYNITVAQDLNADSIYNDRPGLLSTSTAYRSPCGGGLFLDPKPSVGERIIPTNCATGSALFLVNIKISKAFRIGRKWVAATQDSALGTHGGTATGGTAPPSSVGAPGLAMSDGRYTLAFGATVHNLLNTVNAATPVGVVGSPLFEQSIAQAGGAFSASASAANRTVGVGVRFEF